jgi:hypothetical protein
VQQSNTITYQDKKVLKFLIESVKYGNKEVIIDIEDWDKVRQYRWYCDYKNDGKTFYVRAGKWSNNKCKPVYLHRFILGCDDCNVDIDHKNGDGCNNKKENLRSCAHSENMGNQKLRVNNKSGHKGVFWRELNKKWSAQIKVNYKHIYLGLFCNKEDAAHAYNVAAVKYFGKFALINEGV